MSPFKAGVIALLIIAAGTYLGFTKDIPFTKPFTIDAVFKSATSIRTNSPVRIAGVTVGKVKSVKAQPGSDAAIVQLQISKRGLPIHTDATAKIRPRIFLEGNFFVEMTAGTPSAPTLGNGDTIKVTQTSTPVQLDEVLTALQDNTRQNLRTVLSELGTSLSDKPTAAQDRAGDPSTRGQTGAEALHDAYDDIGPAEVATSRVNEAFLGLQPDRDLRRLLSGLSRTTEGLGRNEGQLKDLVTNFDTTMGAFAAEQASLKASIRQLGPTLRNANATFDKLNDAFPATRAFAREILPGVRQTPATIEAGFPWVAQTRRLLAKSELRGLAQDLSPASRDLARLVDTSLALFPQANRIARCVNEVVLPTGDVVIEDEFSSGQPNFREFAYALVGLSGEGQNFDGNGMYVRFQPGGGDQTISYGGGAPGSGNQFASGFTGAGTRPKKPANKPPFNTSVPCYRSQKPDLNGPWAARGSEGTNVGTQPAPTPTPTPTPVVTVPPVPAAPPLPALRRTAPETAAPGEATR
jgi:phospholipid/cholesterol/gamma-HCH transport system substrate-binding protein